MKDIDFQKQYAEYVYNSHPCYDPMLLSKVILYFKNGWGRVTEDKEAINKSLHPHCTLWARSTSIGRIFKLENVWIDQVFQSCEIFQISLGWQQCESFLAITDEPNQCCVVSVYRRNLPIKVRGYCTGEAKLMSMLCIHHSVSTKTTSLWILLCIWGNCYLAIYCFVGIS